ncbi:MAG: hypothetical protein SFZ23_06650 [Planctomycetota bacterium]|nr:hypothetical protein [Planctomycetota bacterium]
MALEAIIHRKGVHRIVLEEYPEGVYVLIYESADAGDDSPCQDHLQNNWEIAKRQAREDFGITDDMWKEIPNTRFNG